MPSLLVVKLSSLGDIVHAVPAADAVRRHLGARMTWVTQPEYVDLVKCIEGVEAVIPFPRRGFLSGVGALRAAVQAARPDLALDLQGLMKSAVAAWLSRAPRRLAPSFSREASHLLHTERAASSGKPHAVDRCLDSARHLGAPEAPARFPFRFPAPPESLFPSPRRRRIALAPCSRWNAKNWPEDRFTAVATALARGGDTDLFVLGGPKDRAVAERIRERSGAPLRILCGELDLPRLGGFLREIDLLLTNDSGPMHLAAAQGTRVLALFGPTDPARTGPYGANCTVLRPEDIDLSAIPANAYKSDNRTWMRGISVERVLEALKG